MLFNSYEFLLLFFPLSFIIYRAILNLSGSAGAQTWLIFASLFFYGYWNPAYLPLILISIVFNFSIAGGMARAAGRARLVLAVAGITANLVALGYFKYASFLTDSFAWLAGAEAPHLSIVLPLAISFFTFQQIAFLVDSYQRKVGRIGIREYSLFVTFFPQLIAGPIVHHSEMMPQFQTDRRRNGAEDLAVGLSIFALGIFKKVIIADTLATYATPVFKAAAGGADISFFAAWGGGVAYTLQIYFDFSGYSDMAIGAARIFGIRLPINFHSPYKALSITDFWRRWHITLSRFLRDYLYIPMGGNRKGKARRYANLFITMLIGGLWHGAGWTFVAWGGLHGLYLTINHIWKARFPNMFNRGFGFVIAWSLTFLSVVIAFVPFRSERFDSTLNIWSGMLGLNGAILDVRLDGLFGGLLPFVTFEGEGAGAFPSLDGAAFILASLAICLVLPNAQELFRKYEPGFFRYDEHHSLKGWFAWRPTSRWAMCTAALFFVSIMSLGEYSEFLYFQF